jgi:hypothetical protein
MRLRYAVGDAEAFHRYVSLAWPSGESSRVCSLSSLGRVFLGSLVGLPTKIFVRFKRESSMHPHLLLVPLPRENTNHGAFRVLKVGVFENDPVGVPFVNGVLNWSWLH